MSSPSSSGDAQKDLSTGVYLTCSLNGQGFGINRCQVCHVTWSRDLNAARNILRNAVSLIEDGTNADYLKAAPAAAS